MRHLLLILALLPLSACAGYRVAEKTPAAPVDVRIIGINDFHGSLDFPKLSIEMTNAKGEKVRVPAGGAAYLASAVDSLRAGHPNSIVVGAGDLIGASPLSSSLFLDEPAIVAMNMIGMEFNAVGNHEFDRGPAELKRMQSGGCEKHTLAEPCKLDRPFPGASFQLLAANTMTEDGKTLFPPHGIKSFGTGRSEVKLGFIGLTLEGTSNLVAANRLKGIAFADEADTANALIPKLKAAGADAIIILIHEGVFTKADPNDAACTGVSGPLMGIIDRLDPAVDVVVSGHTHWAYACDYAKVNPARPVLLTSAGYKGQFVTGIDLKIDPVAGRVIAKSARNLIVQSEAYEGPRGAIVSIQPDFPAFSARTDVATLAGRYREAAKMEEGRLVGTVAGPALREKNPAGESTLGNLIADAQLAAMRPADMGGAQFAFMNPDGIRTDVIPNAAGQVTFGSVFSAQPFSNQLVVKTMTGAQIRKVLEQQFTNPNWLRVLSPSSGFRFAYDLSRPEGERILSMTFDGAPIDAAQSYRVAMSDFLSNGGDMFQGFTQGTNTVVGSLDLEALTAYLNRGGLTPVPALGRVENRTPAAP